MKTILSNDRRIRFNFVDIFIYLHLYIQITLISLIKKRLIPISSLSSHGKTWSNFVDMSIYLYLFIHS